MSSNWYGSAIALLLEASLRVVALAALIGVVLACARVRSSAVRHRTWTAALGAMLLMPVLPSLVPAVGVPLPTNMPRIWTMPEPGSAVLPIADGTLAATPPKTATAAPGATFTLSTPLAPARREPFNRALVILAIYFAVALSLLVRLIAGWRAAARLVRTAVPAGLPGAPAVLESAAVATPMTAGVFSPRVILPTDWRAWAPDTLRAVLAHEHAHVCRRDPLVTFAAHVNRCLFWFHPVAWWLEYRLAADAEHACDDAAVREIGWSRRYAEVLLEMADIVRHNRGRLVCQGLGVDGSGLLGRRIDRILRGDISSETSRLRKASVALGCAAAILIVVACRQGVVPPPPLRENPEVAQTIGAQRAEQAFYERARAMTAAEVSVLEAALKQHPDDLDGWKTLRVFYEASGQEVFGWNEMVARRLPPVLWLIEHRPEDAVAVWLISPAADPAGHAAASQAWRAQAANKDVTAKILSNAARFFAPDDKRTAEALLLRAKALDPEGATVRSTVPQPVTGYWSRRLGQFYGDVLVGPRSPKDGRPTTALDDDAFARDVRSRVLASDDAVMLAAAGTTVMHGSYFDPERGALARRLLERSLQLDPDNFDTRERLFVLNETERSRGLREQLRAMQAELAGLGERLRGGPPLTANEQARLQAHEYEAVASLPEAERLVALVELAEHAYLGAEYLQSIKDTARAGASWERSKRAAQDAVRLAARFRDRPDYGAVVYRATVALALHALREGDREAAVRYMLDSTNVPASEALAFQRYGGLDQRLVNYLLKEGERASVAQFLEQSAALRTVEHNRLLKDAAAIRAGEMPMGYQYMAARG